jgi:hypothetical protein
MVTEGERAFHGEDCRVGLRVYRVWSHRPGKWAVVGFVCQDMCGAADGGPRLSRGPIAARIRASEVACPATDAPPVVSSGSSSAYVRCRMAW